MGQILDNHYTRKAPKAQLPLSAYFSLIFTFAVIMLVIGSTIPAYAVFNARGQLGQSLQIVPQITAQLNDNSFHMDTIEHDNTIQNVSINTKKELTIQMASTDNVKSRLKGLTLQLSPLYNADNLIVSWTCQAYALPGKDSASLDSRDCNDIIRTL